MFGFKSPLLLFSIKLLKLVLIYTNKKRNVYSTGPQGLIKNSSYIWIDCRSFSITIAKNPYLVLVQCLYAYIIIICSWYVLNQQNKPQLLGKTTHINYFVTIQNFYLIYCVTKEWIKLIKKPTFIYTQKWFWVRLTDKLRVCISYGNNIKLLRIKSNTEHLEPFSLVEHFSRMSNFN